MKIKALGRHILIEYYECNTDKLKSPEEIEKHMKKAAVKARATIVQSVFHHFNPYGVSGVVVIQESHLSIHTWPEFGYAAVDIFTCGDSVEPWTAFEYLEEIFEAKKSETTEYPRGITDEIQKYGNNKYKKIVPVMEV